MPRPYQSIKTKSKALELPRYYILYIAKSMFFDTLKCAALVSLRNMNVLVLRYTLDNQELANLSLSRTSQALGSKLL